jgi:sugar lactone lactonase YvrE
MHLSGENRRGEQQEWRIVSNSRDLLGESPQWNSKTGELFWVDFYGPTIRRLSPNGTRTDWVLRQFATIGSLVFCADGRLVIAAENGLHIFDPCDGSTVPFADPNQGRADLAYNDAKVDRHGNYWVGNFDAAEVAPRGILYVLNRNGEWRIGDSGFAVCNGPTFSPKGDVLYFSDSVGRQSLAYDLDRSGRLSGRRVFQRFSKQDGLPDGCCADAEGCTWIALHDGGKIVRLSPRGERLTTLWLPVPRVTACCFGGSNLQTLYVTTGKSAETPDPADGALFAIDVAVPGLPEPMLDLPCVPPHDSWAAKSPTETLF